MNSHGNDNWKAKLVGGGSDGASVNRGRNNSVATRLSAGRPYVLNVHCVAHRLELSILNAIKTNPMLVTVQDMLKKIYKHYHYSPKALRELRAIAESLDEKSVKPTNLDDLLKIVSILSLQFQKDGATCLDFLDSLQTATMHLVQLRQAPGTKLQELLDNIEHRDNNAFYRDNKLSSYAPFNYGPFQTIIDVVIDKVSGRLENPNDPTKAILQATQIFDTGDWPRDRQELAVYGTEQLRLMDEHFGQFLVNIGCDRGQLQQEWMQVKAHLGTPLEDYNAERVVHAWWNGGQQERRPQFDGNANGQLDEEQLLLDFMMNVV
ncbi:unnamed protein product [Mytilus coruscus]|uniref:DUF4371 domain-containing protein n=1 Tax=Mytilus coruscus TaxID=42192 RepID=A0A6J8EHC9_MYTCO|nr:unnamed protein product [Mytilus coruscus]